ncbi:TetR/AcrR family transcriptional regulator [Halosquirtibacter xylanolyticus]|uniref:TetR/AcrR family transcriptional regulator n=1 Tax=Halosquirtibacter xylanolyticus TaxID=3374599 RepID=UPI003748A90E|nr:TetR/AcrR family transcriptional regulator [Prolixibacteraceae bacterium]
MKHSKSEITKELLIRSALDVLCRTSYKGAKLQDVANEVGLSRGAIYWNFKNKIDLYDQVLTHFFEIDSFKHLLNDRALPVVETITNVVHLLLIDEVETNHKSALMYNALVVEKPLEIQPIIDRVDNAFKKMFDSHKALLRHGMATGELRSNINVELETRSFYSFIWGYYTSKDRFFDGQNKEDVCSFVMDKFVLQLL